MEYFFIRFETFLCEQMRLSIDFKEPPESMVKKEIYYKHWIDVETEILANLNLPSYVINTGMAISGVIHIGKCRSDLICPATIATRLRNLGKGVKHYLTLYTQDPFKAKPPLVKPEFAENFSGVRIIDVPCPEDCCSNWVEHFLNPFKSTLTYFDVDPILITTTKMYQMPEMKQIIREIMEKREQVRDIVNRYRAEAKKPQDWIPFNPFCNKCHAISTNFTKALSIDLDNWTAEYECSKCGDHSFSNMELGKLDWRLEWAAIWRLLHVTFEPFGKDHAMAGGSRESCSVLSREVLGFEPPRGQPYEFVSLLVEGRPVEMTSSGGVSFDFDEWPRVAEPEVLKYWYLFMKPMRHLDFSPSKIPRLVDEYDWAESIYFGVEKAEDPEKMLAMKRSYELAYNEHPPKKLLVSVPYDHATLVSQIVPDLSDQEAVLKVLRRTQPIPKEISEEDIQYVMRRIQRAHYWATKYAPLRYQFEVLSEISSEIKQKLSGKDKEALHLLADALETREWAPMDFKAEIYRIARETVKINPRRFFQAVYLVFFGKPSGPRLAPFLLSLDKEFVAKRLREIS